MNKSTHPLYRLNRGLFYLLLLLLVIESLSWLGLKTLDIVMPSTDILPKTDEIYETQSRYTEKLLESQKGENKSILVLDADLGWRYRENFKSPRDQINQQGVRSNHEYPLTAAEGVTRVAVFGDSFAYGSEVSNAEAWSTQSEVLYPDIQVLNYSVPGFGTDQAYLRYLRDGQALSPEFVIIGFAPVNLRRAVNVYRRFISIQEHPLVKPRFILDEHDNLKLMANPFSGESDYQRILTTPQLVKELGQHDHWYSPSVYENPFYDWSATIRLITNAAIIINRKALDPDRLLVGNALSGEQVFNDQSIAFSIQSKLLKKFYNSIIKDGSIPVILFFPGKDDIIRARSGAPTTYSPLVEYLNRHGLKYIDTIEAFAGLPDDQDISQLFAPGGHYSEIANKIVAQTVGNHFSTQDDNSTTGATSPEQHSH